MINLYEKLGILPTATIPEIRAAVKQNERKLTLEDLKKINEWLLIPDNRIKYTSKLYAENPEVLIGLVQKIAEQAANQAVQKYLSEQDDENSYPVQSRSRGKKRGRAELVYGFNLKRLLILALAVVGALSIFLPWYSVPIVGNISGTKNSQAWYSVGAFVAIAITMAMARAEQIKNKIGIAVLSVIAIGANILVRYAIMSEIEKKTADAGEFGKLANHLVSTEFGFYLNVGMGLAILLVLFLKSDD